MIDYRTIQKISEHCAIPPETIEKDYLIEVLLYYIAVNANLTRNLVFRGGTALKKIFFPDFRYSEDLDFITGPHNDLDKIHEALLAVISQIKDKLPITLTGMPYYPQAGHLQAMIEYDIVPEIRSVKRLKLDIVQDTIILASSKKAVIFTFPDFKGKRRTLPSYDLEAIAAEKIGRLLDVVNEPRDIWDLLYIFKTKISTRRLKREFHQKYGISINRNNILRAINKPDYKKLWNSRLAHQIPDLISYEAAINQLEKLFKKALP